MTTQMDKFWEEFGVLCEKYNLVVSLEKDNYGQALLMTYDFKCSQCLHDFEHEQSITDTSVPKCPSCRAKTTVKQISKTSFVLKGTGWFKSGGY
jgi:putative FmdB family regulatory protein